MAGELALVESRSGARFRLTLPAYVETAAPAQGPAGAGVRALVVDDDAPIRKLIVRLLEKRGYEVSEAETGSRRWRSPSIAGLASSSATPAFPA